MFRYNMEQSEVQQIIIFLFLYLIVRINFSVTVYAVQLSFHALDKG